jgi:regulator of protease activity HflC (stomatin/prohibitin superfamily)
MILIPLAVIAFLVLSGIRIAQEYERGVLFRLGRFVALRGPGIYWIIPLGIERSVIIDIRTRTVSAEQQETITRDSVTIKVNAVLWYRVVDSAKSVIAVRDSGAAVYQLALTGLRNIIGQHDLDEVLQQRDKINGLLQQSIAGSTAAWGLEVERFEMKDVELPVAMQQVMAMQAEAIREKRARIIKAEAELEASQKLSAAALQMAENPAALELRRFQMISEVGAENNSTTVIMIPSDRPRLVRRVAPVPGLVCDPVEVAEGIGQEEAVVPRMGAEPLERWRPGETLVQRGLPRGADVDRPSRVVFAVAGRGHHPQDGVD